MADLTSMLDICVADSEGGTSNTETTMLEVCVDSLESAANAIRGGADELELCSALNDGGLTPSAGLVTEVMKLIQLEPEKPRTKVNIMLRCRGGDDFVYTDQEMDTMLADMEIFKQFNVDRFVFGALTELQQIDIGKCQKIVSKADETPVTFHRAFDLCSDPIQSIKTIIELKFDRLLTSGQRPLASDSEAIELIKKLVDNYSKDITIMPGSGINTSNIKSFIDSGCNIVHSSCKKRRELHENPEVKLKGFSLGGKNEVYVTDENIVRQMKELLELYYVK